MPELQLPKRHENKLPHTFLTWYYAFEAKVSKEREYFVDTLSLLVGSGMPMIAAIDALSKEIRSPGMKKILERLQDEIISGLPLWEALDHTRLFRHHTISLIRIGEESGRLSDNLKLIAKQETKDRALQSKVRSAMMYPMLVLTLTLVIGIAISWFILPRLAQVFTSLNLDLPFITKMLILFGTFLGVWGYIVIPIFIGLLFTVIFIFFFNQRTKYLGQIFLFSLPGIRRLFQEVELARFGFLVGTLLDAGVQLTESLRSLEEATELKPYKKLYAHLRVSVEEGHAFQRSFESYPHSNRLISIPIQQLVAAGEQSGNLSKTLITIGETFESRTDETTKNLTVLLEPILLVIVWGGVVSVALAVILPIYNLIGGLTSSRGSAPMEQTVHIDVPVDVPVAESIPNTLETQVPEEVSTQVSDTEESVSAENSVVPSVLTILGTETGYLNVRSGPDISYDVVGTVRPEEQYPFLQLLEGWYEIKLPDGVTGFVKADYVETETP